MAIKTSTVLGNGRDDDRISGFSKATLSGATNFNGGIDQLIGGLVVCQDNSDITGKTLKLFQGAVALAVTNPLPLGLVFENTVGYSSVASGDYAAGKGFDSLDYARGGVYSVFHRPGNFVDVYDDGRNTAQVTVDVNGAPSAAQNFSCPFNAAESFPVGTPVYVTGKATSGSCAGRLTATATGATAIVGVVRASNGLSGNQQIFTIELGIRSAL